MTEPHAPTLLMVPVDGHSSSAGLIQAACRLAAAQGAPWIAVYLDLPQRVLYSRSEEERLTENLRLVERLGGELVQLQPSGLRTAQDFLALARARRVTQIVVGRSGRPRWVERFTGSFLEDLIRGSLHFEIRVVSSEPMIAEAQPRIGPGEPLNSYRVGMAALVVILATGLGFPVNRYLGLTDLVMLYILCITVAAARFGRSTAFLVSVLSVAALDYFFIAPRFTFAVQDIRHVGTFGVMLGVGWMVANLAERIRVQARIAQERERHTGALYRLGSVLAEVGTVLSIQERVETYLTQELGIPTVVVLSDGKGHLQPRHSGGAVLDVEALAIAQWAMEHGIPSGNGTNTLPATRGVFLPMPGSERAVGVLALFPEADHPPLDPDRQSLLLAFASQISLAIERARLAEERTEARIQAEHEKLRSTLLSSVSHDLRTPLGTITGATTTLLEPGAEVSPEDQQVLLRCIHQESCRLQRLVNNLLDLTRLESGQVRVRKEWVPLEEVVGAALNRSEEQLADRPVSVRLPDVWVPLDPVLFEQVLLNLLDNAQKFSPPGSPLEIVGRAEELNLFLSVEDQGPGIPESETERVFEKHFRGRGGSLAPGAGLGLAICRGIVRAHGGAISAHDRRGGGTQILITLPLEPLPPELLANSPD